VFGRQVDATVDAAGQQNVTRREWLRQRKLAGLLARPVRNISQDPVFGLFRRM
jgi:hypothetical protein